MSGSEILEDLLNYLKISANKLSDNLGFKSNVKIYHIKNGRNNISPEVAKLITEKYPEISYAWLITGEGNMLDKKISVNRLDRDRKTNDAKISEQDVPLYDLQAVAGLKELFDTGKPANVLDTIRIPNLPRCDGAITITGDSMYPLLKSGDMVLYAVSNIENIFYGEMYLLGIQLKDFEEFVTVKYIQKSDKENHIKLVSQNKNHDEKDVPISGIRSIALVKASIRINTML